MILYHDSDVEVSKPRIIRSDKGKDFGRAFYLTPIKEQAERMAKRKQRMNHSKTAVVSVYERDEKNLSDIKYKVFKKPNLEWLELIIKCRSDTGFKHGYDIVEGKIADDTVFETIIYVLEGAMKKEDAIERLKFQKINSQIAFCTDKSLNLIKYIESYKVK